MSDHLDAGAWALLGKIGAGAATVLTAAHSLLWREIRGVKDSLGRTKGDVGRLEERMDDAEERLAEHRGIIAAVAGMEVKIDALKESVDRLHSRENVR